MFYFSKRVSISHSIILENVCGLGCDSSHVIKYYANALKLSYKHNFTKHSHIHIHIRCLPVENHLKIRKINAKNQNERAINLRFFRMNNKLLSSRLAHNFFCDERPIKH